MKTKLEIIQRLLDERHINAEEALTLMEKEYQPYPWYPVYVTPEPQPLTPTWEPYRVWCTGQETNIIVN